MANSKSTIEEKTGCALDSFTYPYAFPQAENQEMLREALRRAGYRTGVCTTVGRAGCGTDPYFMERIPVNSCDDMALFQAKLSGAYDWISKVSVCRQNGKNPGCGNLQADVRVLLRVISMYQSTAFRPEFCENQLSQAEDQND